MIAAQKNNNHRALLLALLLHPLAGLAQDVAEQTPQTQLDAYMGDPAAGEFSMPGSRYPAAKATLHIYCRGEGQPTVVMDTGLGAAAIEWLPIQEQISRYTRACIYDRAGYGWSDVGPSPRTSSRIANELWQLLKNSGERAPYILVGHSFGGLNMQMFARRYGYLVAGLVLVDSSNPEQVAKLNLPQTQMNERKYLHGIPTQDFLARPERPKDESNTLAMLAYAMMNRGISRQTVAQEYQQFKRSATQVAQAPLPLPDVPTVILTRGMQESADGKGVRRWARHNEEAWQTLQSDLAKARPHTAHIVAENSGHQMHVEQPDLIADAVVMVADFARTPASGSVKGAASGVSIWLPFAHAMWLSDNLHTSGDTCPFGCSDAVAKQERPPHAGHVAGTAQPAWQRVPYAGQPPRQAAPREVENVLLKEVQTR